MILTLLIASHCFSTTFPLVLKTFHYFLVGFHCFLSANCRCPSQLLWAQLAGSDFIGFHCISLLSGGRGPRPTHAHCPLETPASRISLRHTLTQLRIASQRIATQSHRNAIASQRNRNRTESDFPFEGRLTIDVTPQPPPPMGPLLGPPTHLWGYCIPNMGV